MSSTRSQSRLSKPMQRIGRGQTPEIGVAKKPSALIDELNGILPYHYKLLMFKSMGFLDLNDHRLVRRQLVEALTKSNRVIDWGLELPWQEKGYFNVGRLRAGCRAYVNQLDDVRDQFKNYVDEIDYASELPALAKRFPQPSAGVRYVAAKIDKLKSQAEQESSRLVELSVQLEFSEHSQFAVASLNTQTAVLKIVHLGDRA